MCFQFLTVFSVSEINNENRNRNQIEIDGNCQKFNQTTYLLDITNITNKPERTTLDL